MEIEILAVGTEVTIDKDIPAHVRRVEIRGINHQQISYECVWWDERVRKAEWLERDEIKPRAEHKTVRIRPRGIAAA